MKKILLGISLIVATNVAMSQDTIKTMHGDEISVKVKEITKEEVMYTDGADVDKSMRIVEIDRILFEDGTVKIFGGVLGYEEKRDHEKLRDTVHNKEEKLDVEEKKLEHEPVVSYSREMPQSVYSIAKRGAKVFLQSRDNNAAIHLKNYISDWGYWEVTSDRNSADFIIRLDVQFQVPMDFYTRANFIDVKSNTKLYSSEEYVADRSNRDPNRKRAAVKYVVDKVFIANFN